MDGTGEHYAKWNKPGGEGQIPYDLTFNWNIINRRKNFVSYKFPSPSVTLTAAIPGSSSSPWMALVITFSLSSILEHNPTLISFSISPFRMYSFHYELMHRRFHKIFSIYSCGHSSMQQFRISHEAQTTIPIIAIRYLVLGGKTANNMELYLFSIEKKKKNYIYASK